MKKAQDYIIEIEGLFGSKYEMDYGLSDIIRAMHEYAEAEREKAFEAARKRHLYTTWDKA